DSEIVDHCTVILPQLQRRFQERYYQLGSDDEPNPNVLQTLQLLVHVVQSLIGGGRALSGNL
ncbi:hypothetical protein BC936DRAFT_136852, partial [Jimgerdemannia flammicorona]